MRNPPGIFICLCLSACAQVQEGATDSTLDALKTCPQSEVACVTMTANLHWPVRGGAAIQEHPAVLAADRRVENGDYGIVTVVVTARLNDGTAGQYRLNLDYPDDMLGCNDFSVAALGAREGGGGTILTRQGRLEILSSEIVIGSWTTVGMIDPDRGTIAYSVAPDWERYSWDGRVAMTSSGALFWQVRGRCLDLNADGRFRPLPEGSCESLRLTPATEADVTRVRDAKVFDDPVANLRLPFDLWRAEGSPHLVYIWSAACS